MTKKDYQQIAKIISVLKFPVAEEMTRSIVATQFSVFFSAQGKFNQNKFLMACQPVVDTVSKEDMKPTGLMDKVL